MPFLPIEAGRVGIRGYFGRLFGGLCLFVWFFFGLCVGQDSAISWSFNLILLTCLALNRPFWGSILLSHIDLGPKMQIFQSMRFNQQSVMQEEGWTSKSRALDHS